MAAALLVQLLRLRLVLPLHRVALRRLRLLALPLRLLPPLLWRLCRQLGMALLVRTSSIRQRRMRDACCSEVAHLSVLVRAIMIWKC